MPAAAIPLLEVRKVRIRVLLAAAGLVIGLCTLAQGQFKDAEPGGIKLGEGHTQRWRTGVTVDAVGGPCTNVVCYIPFPAEWPEQDVEIVKEDVSAEAKVSYEMLEGQVKLMIVRIAKLPAGKQARALLTLDIHHSPVLAPEETDGFVLPEAKKLDRKIAPFLQPSPLIESRDPKIRDLAKQIGVDQEKAWERVESIYDWVRDHVQYKKGPQKGALGALKDGIGDCEGMTSLFVAICRAAEIPARMVQVPEHCYPEFYLLDEKGQGHWFPCQAAGTRSFGGIPEERPILQKGDNVRPPWDRQKHERLMPWHVEGTKPKNGGDPRPRWYQEKVPEGQGIGG
jgi:hypothetical protein